MIFVHEMPAGLLRYVTSIPLQTGTLTPRFATTRYALLRCFERNAWCRCPATPFVWELYEITNISE